MRVGARCGAAFFFCALRAPGAFPCPVPCAIAKPPRPSAKAVTAAIKDSGFIGAPHDIADVRTVAHHGTCVNARSPTAGTWDKKRSMSPRSDPKDWRGVKAPSLAEFEQLAEEAYARLPQRFRALCTGIVIQVDDFPTDEVLDHMGAQTEFDLLGLFQGVGLPFRSDSVSGQMPNMIWLYRRPILDYWAEHDETLGRIITHVLIHEIGHHFGLSDADMEAIEQSVD